MADPPLRPILTLLNVVDVTIFTFNEPIQDTNSIDEVVFPVSSSNEAISSVEAVESTESSDSDFVEPTQDSSSLDGSCPRLAEIQV